MAYSPSKLLPLFFALIILLLIPIISLVNINDLSIFTIKTFSHYLASFHGNNKPNQYPPNNFSTNPSGIKSSNIEKNNKKPRLRRSNWRYPFIGFKNIDNSNISRAISLDASKCFPVSLPPHAITATNCCPPIPTPFKFVDFKDFQYSQNVPLRVRKPAHLVDEEYIAKFEKGIALMKSLPSNDPRSFIQQAKVHCAYCNGAYHQQHPFGDLKVDIHSSWLFFPFHRWYLYFFERILGNLIEDPNFALPFWNWDSIEGMHIPHYFTNQNSSLYHKLRHDNHMPPHVVDLDYNGNDNNTPYQKQVSYNLATMYKVMVLASTKELFIGNPLRVGDESHPGKGSVERAPHNTVHTWVGAAHTPNHEDMGTFYTAARDPIFYPHHANIDRMWATWKKLGENGRRDYSDDLDWLESQFFFYDENANLVRVKIRDCIDTKKLGYVYQDVELPWVNYSPKSKIMSKTLRKAKRAKLLGSIKGPNKFPLVLDSVVSTIVKRPKKLRSKGEKEQEEEVLVIEGVEFGSDKYVKFDVHVDDDEDELSGPDRIEFVGSFVSLRHGHGGKIKTRFKVGISKVLESLEAEDDDDVVVTLVPKVGKGEVTIGSIKIEFIPRY